jgi:predicted RNA binding protein YcfA (HicA-like mRNA interferase family)
MAGPNKTLETIKQGGRNIAFRDLQRLLEKLGFRLNRISGSHHIYIHPRVSVGHSATAILKVAELSIFGIPKSAET